MFTSLLILAATVPALPRTGASCPLGYYYQATYCVPGRSITPSRQSINRTGASCPLGTYTYSNYCTLRY